MTKEKFLELIKEKLNEVETSDSTIAYQIHPMWTTTTT